MAKYKMKSFFPQFGKNDKFTPLCNAIVFRNAGEVQVRINDNWVLEPGDETPTISTGFPDVVDETEYTIAFDPTSVNPNRLVNVIYTQIQLKEQKSNFKNCENL